MSDDLVKRLRDGVPCCDPDAGNGEGSFYIDDANETMCEAADRIEALTAENERLNAGLYQAQEIALKAWADKTEWVQQTCQNHELGLHRADVLRYRIEALEAENARLRGEIVYFLNDRSSWFNKPSGYDRLRAALGDTD